MQSTDFCAYVKSQDDTDNQRYIFKILNASFVRHPEFLTYWFSSRCPFGDDVLVAKVRPCNLAENKPFAIMNEDHERIEMDLVCYSLQFTNLQQNLFSYAFVVTVLDVCVFLRVFLFLSRLVDQPNPMGHRGAL